MSDPLIAESLFLLMHDEGTGRWRAAPAPLNGLAGALLLELALGGLVRVDGKALVASDGNADDPLLRSALAVMRSDAKPRAAGYWVRRLPVALKPLDRRVGAALVERGVLEETRRTVLGLFHTTRWPAADRRPGQELRNRLATVLTGGEEPDAREAMLIALLGPLGLVAPLVDRPLRRAAKTRAKQITERSRLSHDTSAAVAQAVQAIHAGVAATAAAAAASAATTS